MTDVLDRLAPPNPEVPAEPTAPAPPPRLAIVLGNIGRGMILAGIVVLLFVVFQLWGTDIQEARAQGDLRNDLETRFDDAALQLERFLVPNTPASTGSGDAAGDADPTEIDAGQPGDEVTALPAPEPDEVDEALLALLFPADGDALAKIEIPSIEVDKIVVRGVAVADLRKGPGHYSETSLPGNAGNAGVAGHRTTYGSPFNRIDELVPGDEIVVTSVQGEFRYRVIDPLEAFADDLGQIDAVGGGHIIVHPSATWVLDDFGDDRLTLTACHPKLSSRQRIIVAAELVDDSVELPDWAVEAQAARTTEGEPAILADEPIDTVADETVDDEQLGAAGAADPVDTAEEPTTAGADLDEGLNGERDAIPPAAAWMLAAIALWYAGGRLGRRFAEGRLGRFGCRFVGFVPAFVCLWLSFELIDRALPAG